MLTCFPIQSTNCISANVDFDASIKSFIAGVIVRFLIYWGRVPLFQLSDGLSISSAFQSKLVNSASWWCLLVHTDLQQAVANQHTPHALSVIHKNRPILVFPHYFCMSLKWVGFGFTPCCCHTPRVAFGVRHEYGDRENV